MSDQWKKQNEKIPCVVFSNAEDAAVRKIVSRVHGAVEAASRVGWGSIAKARFNRDNNQQSEPGLDLFEKFLANTKEISPITAQLWAGSYPITILDEALKRVATRIGYKTSREVSDAYPKLKNYRKAIDAIVIDIGNDQLGFDRGGDNQKGVRGTDFGVSLGIPPLANGNSNSQNSVGSTPVTPNPTSATSAQNTGIQPIPQKSGRKISAIPINDPRTIKRELRSFIPKGSEREKLDTLIQYLKYIKIDKTSHAFCFVLRSVFELSARAYCNDNASSGVKFYNAQGEARKLKDILVDIIIHLVTDPATGKKIQSKSQQLHGASTEINDSNSLLSVTSMNALVHSQTFAVSPTHICIVFAKVLPLLKAMNS